MFQIMAKDSPVYLRVIMSQNSQKGLAAKQSANVIRPTCWLRQTKPERPLARDFQHALVVANVRRTPPAKIRGKSIQSHILAGFYRTLKGEPQVKVLPRSFATSLPSIPEVAKAFEAYAAALCNYAAQNQNPSRQWSVNLSNAVKLAARQLWAEHYSEPVAHRALLYASGHHAHDAVQRKQQLANWQSHPYARVLAVHAGYLVHGWVSGCAFEVASRRRRYAIPYVQLAQFLPDRCYINGRRPAKPSGLGLSVTER